MMTRIAGFFIGMVFAILCGLALLASLGRQAKGAEPDVPQMVLVVGYLDGSAIGGHVLGFADSLGDCQKALAQLMPELHPKPGVLLAGVCTPLPPAPKAGVSI